MAQDVPQCHLEPEQIDDLYSALVCDPPVESQAGLPIREPDYTCASKYITLYRRRPGRHGDAPALTYKDITVTYAELWREVAFFGAALKGLGIRRGDRVAVYLDKRIETVTALFGASAGDGVFVPVNPLLRPKQVGYIMRDCDCPGPGDIAGAVGSAARGTRAVQVCRTCRARGSGSFRA